CPVREPGTGVGQPRHREYGAGAGGPGGVPRAPYMPGRRGPSTPITVAIGGHSRRGGVRRGDVLRAGGGLR
ncbi:hypothetical protein ACFWGI_35575, partial [Streptomyces niveus]|uniref:hypothetical protein n=1 Tax=Streptomyces niveus TaxID=193462 RepID=UPI003662857E